MKIFNKDLEQYEKEPEIKQTEDSAEESEKYMQKITDIKPDLGDHTLAIIHTECWVNHLNDYMPNHYTFHIRDDFFQFLVTDRYLQFCNEDGRPMPYSPAGLGKMLIYDKDAESILYEANISSIPEMP